MTLFNTEGICRSTSKNTMMRLCLSWKRSWWMPLTNQIACSAPNPWSALVWLEWLLERRSLGMMLSRLVALYMQNTPESTLFHCHPFALFKNMHFRFSLFFCKGSWIDKRFSMVFCKPYHLFSLFYSLRLKWELLTLFSLSFKLKVLHFSFLLALVMGNFLL